MMSTRGWLSDLKLRGSWGINGNDLIDNEAFYAKYLMSLDRGSYNMSGDGVTLSPGAYRHTHHQSRPEMGKDIPDQCRNRCRIS